MEFWLIWGIAINIAFSGLVAYVASQKGRSPIAFFFLSFFCSFFVGILVALALPAVHSKETMSRYSSQLAYKNGEQIVKCPHCAEWVKAEAKVCKHCGREIEQSVQNVFNEAKQAEILANEESDRITQEFIANQRAKKDAFRKSPQFKFLLAGSSIALLALLAGAVYWVVSPKPSPWLEAVESCGMTKGFYIAEDSIVFTKLNRNYEVERCVLDFFNGSAGSDLGHSDMRVLSTYTGVYKNEKLEFIGEWNWDMDQARYTITR